MALVAKPKRYEDEGRVYNRSYTIEVVFRHPTSLSDYAFFYLRPKEDKIVV
jgi:hypothetical protein